MGSCFFVSGLKYRQQVFNTFATRSITSLTLLAFCWILIPSVLYGVVGGYAKIELLSHVIAITLLLLYILYLLFTLRTHRLQFSDEVGSDEEDASAETATLSLGPTAATVWLAVSLTCVTLCAVALVSSIQSSTWKARKTFVGFVLFPFLGNFTDYLSACTVALKNTMDITILVTIGSSMQLLLFTLPVLNILGWIMSKPMTFCLDLFETVIVFLGIFIVNGLVSGGRSNYLSGAMCIAL